MKILEVKTLVFPELKVIRYYRFCDERGYFTETLRESDFHKVIPDFQIKQVNESHSKKNTVRGLHFQWNPYMGKLVRTVHGHMVDLFLDIRTGSPTYGKIAAYDLPASYDLDYNEWIWIPVGFAHGNYYLENSTIEYFCTGEYNPTCEVGISPFGEDVDWSLCEEKLKEQFEQLKKEQFIISDKDKQGLTIEDWNHDERSKYFNYNQLKQR